MREDDHRGGGIDIKVEELNGGADEEATTTLLRELTGAVSCACRVWWLWLA
jgi:hypothetical protein